MVPRYAPVAPADGPVATPRFRRALPWMLPVFATFVVAATALRRVPAAASTAAAEGIALAVSREDHSSDAPGLYPFARVAEPHRTTKLEAANVAGGP